MNKSAVLSGVGLLAGLLLVGGGLPRGNTGRSGRLRLNDTAVAAVCGFVRRKDSVAARSRLVGTVIGKRSVNLANGLPGLLSSGIRLWGDCAARADAAAAGHVDEQADPLRQRGRQNAAQSGVARQPSRQVAKSNLDLTREQSPAVQRARFRRARSREKQMSIRSQSEVDKGVATLERSNSMLGRAKAERGQAKREAAGTLIAKKTLHAFPCEGGHADDPSGAVPVGGNERGGG